MGIIVTVKEMNAVLPRSFGKFLNLFDHPDVREKVARFRLRQYPEELLVDKSMRNVVEEQIGRSISDRELQRRVAVLPVLRKKGHWITPDPSQYKY
jgi:hypothetical protein